MDHILALQQTQWVYPKDTNLSITDPWIILFTAKLFMVAKIQMQSKCPSSDEWPKMQNMYINEHYSGIKKAIIYIKMDDTWGHPIEWNKPGTWKQIFSFTGDN